MYNKSLQSTFYPDFRHNITVQPSPTMRPEIVGLRMPASPESPPASPNLPRLRAYACKYKLCIEVMFCDSIAYENIISIQSIYIQITLNNFAYILISKFSNS